MTENAIKTDKKRILIAEDDETSFMLLQVFLAPENYEILYASDGRKALQLFKENPKIDLILMDLKMPVLDGYQATRQIREMDKKIPIIAQTAYALAGDNKKAFDAGCTDYITKPINRDILVSKIQTLIDK